MKSKTLVTLVTVFVLAAMVLSACQTAAATPAPTAAATAAPTAAATAAATTAASNPDTIIIGTTDKVASLDPADAYATHDWEVIKNISDGLVTWKPGTTDLEPDLATDLGTASADGLTWTFTLKDGIKFGDGTPLTATVYAAQLNRLLTIGPSCPNGVALSLAKPFIKSISAPDDKTIVFVLISKIAYFQQILATAPFVASDPATFKADACNLFPAAPVYGTGPWFISQYNADEQMVLEPNPYYTGAYKPQVKQIIVRFYSDPNTMALAVQSGEIDVAWRLLSPDQLTTLKSDSNLTIGTVNGGSIRYLILNHNKAPFNDPNVRKAVAASIDRNEISDTVFGGQVNPLYSQVPPGFLGANEAFDKMYASPDLEAAKKFLAASGYSESKPVEITLMYPPEHYGASTAAWMQVIKKQLEATGMMKVTLTAQEWSTYAPALTTQDVYEAGVLGWFFDYPDSSNYIDPFVYNGGEGTNVTKSVEGDVYGTPVDADATKLVNLLKQADVEQDNTKRADLYDQAQTLYADMVVTLPLFYEAEHVVYRANISGDSAFATPETLNIGPNVLFLYSMLSKSAK